MARPPGPKKKKKKSPITDMRAETKRRESVSRGLIWEDSTNVIKINYDTNRLFFRFARSWWSGSWKTSDLPPLGPPLLRQIGANNTNIFQWLFIPHTYPSVICFILTGKNIRWDCVRSGFENTRTKVRTPFFFWPWIGFSLDNESAQSWIKTPLDSESRISKYPLMYHPVASARSLH